MEVYAFVLSIIAFLFGIASFLINYFMGRKVVRSSTYSSMMERLFEINRIELEKPKLYELLHHNFSDESEEKGGTELSTYLFMLFNLYAEIFTQHTRYRLFDKDQMQIWESRIENDFFERLFLRGYWIKQKKKSSKEFTEEFKQFINARLEVAENRPVTISGKS